MLVPVWVLWSEDETPPQQCLEGPAMEDENRKERPGEIKGKTAMWSPNC